MLFTFPLYHLSQDEISSPLSARIFELCNPELFPEALQNSEVTSSSNCCYEENNSSYPTNILDVETKFNNSNSNNNTIVTTPTSTNTNNNNNNNSNNSNNLSVIFDSQEEIDNDISASIDFSLSPSFNVPSFLPVTSSQQEQFDFNSHVQQLTSCSSVEGFSQFHNPNDSVAPLLGTSLSLPPVFEEDCITSVPSYLPLNPSSPSCNYLNPAGIASYMPPPPGSLATSLSADSAALFGGNMLLGSELQTQELDYQGDNGRMYCPDPIQRVFNPPDLQVFYLVLHHYFLFNMLKTLVHVLFRYVSLHFDRSTNRVHYKKVNKNYLRTYQNCLPQQIYRYISK
jgi:hypothetical protein